MGNLVQVCMLDNKSYLGLKKSQIPLGDVLISATIDPETNKYKHGLSQEEVKKYEKLLNCDLDGIYVYNKKDEMHPFFDSVKGQIRLKRGINVFNLENIEEYLQYRMLKASGKIADNEEIAKTSFNYEFYFKDEVQEQKVKASKIAKRNDLAVFLSKMDIDDKISLIGCVTSHISYKKGTFLKKPTEQQVLLELEALIEKNMNLVLQYVNHPVRYINDRAFVLRALYKREITEDNDKLYYFDTMVGNNIEEAVEFFNNTKNGQIKTKIINALDD